MFAHDETGRRLALAVPLGQRGSAQRPARKRYTSCPDPDARAGGDRPPTPGPINPRASIWKVPASARFLTPVDPFIRLASTGGAAEALTSSWCSGP
jgi:hypothetical protein